MVCRASDDAREACKRQADGKRVPQKEFRIGDKVYLSTKFLQSRQPCKMPASQSHLLGMPVRPRVHSPNKMNASDWTVNNNKWEGQEGQEKLTLQFVRENIRTGCAPSVTMLV